MNYYNDDTFVEELVVKRGGIRNILLGFLMAVAALVLIAACFLFLPALLPAIMAIAVAGVYLGVKFLGVEYEYSFTNGDLDIDKIMAKRKRKRVLETDYQKIQVMAPYTAEYESETKGYQITSVLDVSSSKNAAGRWFFICADNDGKYTFVVFQPSKRMREAIRKYCRSKIKGMDA